MATTNHRLMQFSIFLAAALLASTVAGSARADDASNVETTTSGDDYGYKFKDEALLGSTLANTGDIFGGRKRFQRVILVRPRTDLRIQLLKSVENL